MYVHVFRLMLFLHELTTAESGLKSLRNRMRIFARKLNKFLKLVRSYFGYILDFKSKKEKKPQ